MVGFDEERLIDPGVVQVVSGCCQQAQEDITGSEGLGKLQKYTIRHIRRIEHHAESIYGCVEV